MIYHSNSTNSIECCEASKVKVEVQQSGPVLKKQKKIILASQNVENCEAAERQDRLSDLPDCLIHHILSFMETKDAIKTCILSKRWRYLWTSIPCLNLCSKSFSRLTEFRRFVTWVLSHRESAQVKVLIYCRFGVDYSTDQSLMNKVLEYATSHCVEEIRINLRGKVSGSPPFKFPPCLRSCQSLKRLELKNCHAFNVSTPFNCTSLEALHLGHFSFDPIGLNCSSRFASLAKLFGFATLTTLHLDSFTLCYTGIEHVDPFADFVNLKNLHLSKICFKSDLNPKEFVISAPQLNNLSLMSNRFKCKLVISAPELTNFSYLHSTPRAFLEFNVPSLHNLMIDIHEPHDRSEKSHEKRAEETLHGLINMSRGNHNAKAAKLSFCTVAVASGDTALLKHEGLSFRKLKSLDIEVGSTYKIFVNNLDHITAYFRNCFQHTDFEIVNI